MSEKSAETIVVIYDKANTLSLPYVTGEGKKRAVKYFKFVPGKNVVPSEVWDAINAELGEDRMANHARYLKPSEIEVKEDGGIDFDSIKNATEMCDLIENTMNLDELARIKVYEDNRDKPRKSVLSAIEDQIGEIEKFNKAVKDGEG